MEEEMKPSLRFYPVSKKDENKFFFGKTLTF
jgi:hypothetical protein